MKNDDVKKLDSSKDNEFYAFRVEADSDKIDEFGKYLTRGLNWEYMYAILGLVIGCILMLFGVALTIRGAAGAVSWSAKILQLESEINDAGPGAIVCLIGLFVVIVTRPSIVLRKPRAKLIGITLERIRELARQETKQWDALMDIKSDDEHEEDKTK